jgi:MFS family permease
VLLANILFLTSVWGYSILKAGFAVTPGPLLAATSSALAGRMIDRHGQRVSAAPGGLLFALGCLLFATGLGSEPAYVTSFLPATVLTGIGVGLSFAGWSSAAVAELPPARFATGSAISSCFRQLGAVLGISVLIALVGSSPALSEFHRAYTLMAVTGLTAGLIGLTLRRVRGTVPSWTSKSAPSTTPSPERAPSAARS